ncbi:hypothetical protein [Armatimonas rosea]|uniref:Uncharacterized protein n=1 Tax=Armatimonas rosea TaxID=685828 RepID=A0A7W9STV0_ARMRO|nr:hypothetical protein [Armatimonas rosea]MBB6052300.1 hypothetical protein [Armatimonas rosea]
MQQLRQEILLGKQPVPRIVLGIVLALSLAVLMTCGLYFTGRLSEVELFRPNYQGKSGFAQSAVWLIGFAIVCPVFLLTQWQHGFTFTGQKIAVQKNGELVWEKKCAAWRWRISGKKDIVGLELLDDAGEAFLVQRGGIPLGRKEPFDALVQALTRAGITETDAHRKRLPFTQDTAAWLWITLAVLGIALFGGMAWSLIRMTPTLDRHRSEEAIQRYYEQPPVLPRRTFQVRHYPREKQATRTEQGTSKL